MTAGRLRSPALARAMSSAPLAAVWLALLWASPVVSVAESPPRVLRVGPTRALRTLQDVAGTLVPGDVVEVDAGQPLPGGVVFDRPGTADRPITIRGRKAAGRRPVIAGGRDGIECGGSHYVLEGLEITAAGRRGVNHRAHDVTIRDCVIHGCPNGIMSSDHASGDLTVEYCEVFGCGRDQGEHQFYVASDEDRCPGAEFRLRFCWVHDGSGGNNVKSRAERSTIYANWISDAFYHNLDLVGADPAGGARPDRAREDGEVVGNVLIASRYGRNVRIGGDGTGQSDGRYRFLNNTFIHRGGRPESHLQARFGIESVEMHNNLFVLPPEAASAVVFDDARAEWVGGVRRVGGT
ncbi:MAG: hypothetical protein EBX36_11075, partial [Planctomycetia bacterium]|nr:hypothetical protein [Planctomycetia bacterium]